MATNTASRRPKHDNTPLIAGVAIAVLVLSALLVWQNSQAQDRLSTLRSGQSTGLAQRTDQTQLTCALWAILRDAESDKVTPAVRSSADEICSTIPTPTPSASQ